MVLQTFQGCGDCPSVVLHIAHKECFYRIAINPFYAWLKFLQSYDLFVKSLLLNISAE